MFSKNVDIFGVIDYQGNPIGNEQNIKVSARADFYWNRKTNSGMVKVTDLIHGDIYKYPTNKLSTGYARGIKIYYFKTTDGRYKFSVSKEEEGFAIGDYFKKEITVYGNE